MDIKDYTHIIVCKKALNNDELFNAFKRNRDYRSILEHTSYKHIILKLKYFKNKYKEYLNYLSSIDWDKIKLNDTIGNAIKYDFKEEMEPLIKLDSYYFSPSTLQYLIEGFEILYYFKEYSKSTEIDILEIGGGYGGQCYILYILINIFNINIKSYSIIDLEYITLFQEKYLDKLGINITTINYQDMDNMFKNKENNINNIFKKNYNILISIMRWEKFLGKFKKYILKI